MNGMIELTFQAAKGPMVVQLGAPVLTSDPDMPWSVNVGINGRAHNMIGEDPVDALAHAVYFLSVYLGKTEGLDPPVAELPGRPPALDSTPSEPPDPAKDD
jgi:hypothetical protein